MHPAPYRVSAISCPLASTSNMPCWTLDDARRAARWMADFIYRVDGRCYQIDITQGGGPVESATSDEWRAYTQLNLDGPNAHGA